MDREQAKNRIEELNKLTAYYAKRYYDEDKPEISDFEYDMLMNELKNLEKEFPFVFLSSDIIYPPFCRGRLPCQTWQERH